MKPITTWSIGNNEGTEFTFHHMEYDWATTNYPQPVKPEFTNQNAWKNSKWQRDYKMIDEHGVIVN